MTDPTRYSLVGATDGGLMMEHMREFDRWTKHAGTPEERESLSYCDGVLRKYGYETKLIEHDAYISLPGPGRVEVAGEVLECIVHSFSQPTDEDGVTARVAYLVNGKDEDFAGRDLEGVIVLVEGIANPAAGLRASAAGAVGQIHISPHEFGHEMCVSPVWGSPTHETVGRLPTSVIMTVGLSIGASLKEQLAGNAELEATLFAEVDTGWRKTPILVAELPSPEGGAHEPYVLFTGHHDTWYFGVMDNGGANATMLEVARLCAQQRDEWKRGLRIIFWSGHSQGRYSSSTWYADEFWEDIEQRAVVHVNIDSTGGRGNTVVSDMTAAAELASVASQAIEENSDQKFTKRRMPRAGDQSFWGIGVPAVFCQSSEQPGGQEENASAAVFGADKRAGHGTGWWWHTPFDTLDKIDETILVRDTRIYVHCIWRLLTDAILPLDYAAHAVYLKAELDALHDLVGYRFDLTGLYDRVALLESRATELNVRAAGASGAKVVDRINRCLVEVSRHIVPVDYTKGDRFEHDAALPQAIYPALQPLRDLSRLEPDSAEAKFLDTGMKRACNRVSWALREANNALASCLADLEAT
ncbi:MAG: M28 family peptidase [Rhodospirillales bacterium]|nr:M28 family peptidase [Rhodospirillales bacterium]